MFDLAISPCPNDTFIFHHLKETRPDMRLEFADVEELNLRALGPRRHAVSKLSFFAILQSKDYRLLDAGGAMGRGCGPLLIFRKGYAGGIENLKHVIIPGRTTTAALLLELFLSENHPSAKTVERAPIRYDKIIPALLAGFPDSSNPQTLAPADGQEIKPEADAGLIIHEDRFTYQKAGLVAAVDLGAWWERTTGMPIPLGGIVVRKDMGEDFAIEIEKQIRESVRAAWANPDRSRSFVKSYSQSLEDDVIQSHIDLYVNRYTESFGTDGHEALSVLRDRAIRAGLLGA